MRSDALMRTRALGAEAASPSPRRADGPARSAPAVVVIGAGPVGLRAAAEVARRDPGRPLVLYGDEAVEPYNRVRLSSLLAGDLRWTAVLGDSALPHGERVDVRLGCRVVAIDRARRLVVDAQGREQAWSQIVLATGSRPVVPDIPGIRRPGVFTFRDAGDAERLMARRVRSRRTVVIGGGLLGLEAARAMRRFRTHVCVIEHGDRLMARQLDHVAAGVLCAHVERLGIEVLLGDAVREIEGHGEGGGEVRGEVRGEPGEGHVEGRGEGAAERSGGVRAVRLRSGRRIECDTVVVAAGIVPNIDLALASGLAIGRGIKVDDCMRTTDASIFAVGECAEHAGRVYGLVAPGLEQAAVAAHNLVAAGADASARYTGSIAATRLKVLDLPVFSIGVVGDEVPDLADVSMWRGADGGYRSVVCRRGRAIGAIAIGAWDDLGRVQEAVLQRRRLWPWQRWRLRRSGSLWPAAAARDVREWPDSAVVCNCTGVTCGDLRGALRAGCATAAELSARTGASSVCGSCRPQLESLAGDTAGALPPVAVRGARWMWGAGVAAAAVAAAVLLLPGVPYPRTWDLGWRWDALWRDTTLKQASGFALLALMAALSLVSLRKRVRRVRLGEFAGWRVVHVMLGATALLALLVHSGGRFGANLNSWLALSVVGAAAAGALASAAVAREHVAPALARRLKRGAFWTHVLVLWPLPVLLAFHVVKTYAF